MIKQKISQAYKLWENEHYDRAMEIVSTLREEFPGNAQLLVMWACLAQLLERNAPTLAEIKHALQSAAELEGPSPGAAIELAHFLDAVEDNPRAASRIFANAIAQARTLLIDGLVGQAGVLLQLNKRSEATRCLIEALRLTDVEPTRKRHSHDSKNGGRAPSISLPPLDFPGPFSTQIQSLLDELLTKTA
jgi:hypothetical protein